MFMFISLLSCVKDVFVPRLLSMSSCKLIVFDFICHVHCVGGVWRDPSSAVFTAWPTWTRLFQCRFAHKGCVQLKKDPKNSPASCWAFPHAARKGRKVSRFFRLTHKLSS